MTAAPDALAALRARLTALRDDVLRQLAEDEVLDGGMLALLGNTAAALDALDTMPAEVVSAERAVVADDGMRIKLVVYDGAAARGAVPLDSARAVNLAGALIAAAARRLRQ
jgi:hypothetical protein